jgi:hypothetical protein
MAFPTSPMNGQRYGQYIYNASVQAWEIFPSNEETLNKVEILESNNILGKNDDPVSNFSDSAILLNERDRAFSLSHDPQTRWNYENFEDLHDGRGSGELIVRGDCESSTPPMIFGETVPYTTNASLELSNVQVYSGNYSYKCSIVSGSVTTVIHFEDVGTTVGTDLHGLLTGVNYIFKLKTYVPSGQTLAPSSIKIQIYNYITSWVLLDSTDLSTTNSWEEIESEFLIDPFATGIIIRILINGSSGSDNDYFYIDGVSLKTIGTADLEQKINNLIERGDCESTTPPMIFGETVPLTTDATFARSSDQAYEGTYSYKMTKTSAAGGTTSRVYLVDDISSADLHGLIAGLEYTIVAQVYIPSSGGPAASETKLYIQSGNGGFTNSDVDTASEQDEWEELTATLTLDSSDDRFRIIILLETTAALNEYIYIDNIRLYPTSQSCLLPSSNISLLEDARIGTVDNPHAKYWPGQSAYIGAARENLVPFPNELNKWENANSAAVELATNEKFKNYEFSKVICTSTSAAYVIQKVTFTVSTGSVQAILRRGTGNGGSQLRIYDYTDAIIRGRVVITWKTGAVSFDGGATHTDSEWLDDDTIFVRFVANDIVPGNTNRVLLYPATTEAAGEYVFITAIQVEDASFPTPFIDPKWKFLSSDGSLTRAASGYQYTYELQDTITFDCIVRPWYPYDDSAYHMFFRFYVDSDSILQFYWYHPGDTILVYWRDGGTGYNLSSQQFDDGTTYTDLNQRIRITGKLALTGGISDSWLTVEPLESGSEYTDSEWSGTPNSKSSTFSTINVGEDSSHEAQAESEIEYLRIYEQALTKTQIDTGDYDPDFEFLPEPLIDGFLPQPMGQDGCIGAWSETENLVATTDLDDSSEWSHSATYHSSQENVWDQELQEMVWYWEQGSNTASTYIYDENKALSDGAYTIGCWIKSNYSIYVRKGFLYATPNVAASFQTIEANTWTLIYDTISGTTITGFQIVMIYKDSAISTFPADIWFKATRPLLINNAYYRPFTQFSRQASAMYFTMQEPRMGTVMCWVRPFFNYDSGTTRYAFGNYDSDYGVMLQCYSTTSSFRALIKGSTTVAIISSSSFTSNLDFQRWHHVAITWDNYSHSYKFYLNGSLVGTSTLNIGTLKTYGHFDIGGIPNNSSPAGYEFDGLISDTILDNTVWSELEIQKHYNKNRPFYSPDQVLINGTQLKLLN